MRPVFVMGPCSLESRDVVMRVAEHLHGYFERLGDRAEWIFKGSFLKDNRTAEGSYEGPGMEKGLAMLEEVSRAFGVRMTTDVHGVSQVRAVADVVDVIQVPAFLCRQSSLLREVGAAGRTVNVKKGQFMNPANMRGAVDKLTGSGCEEVWLTERGSFFGYGDLVVDFRSLSIMSGLCDRVILDVTHSLQRPGALGDSSGGRREFAPSLARAGAAWGVGGLFIETHPHPESALSDAATMVDLPTATDMVGQALEHWEDD